MKNRLEIQNRLEQRKNRNGLVGTRLEVNEIEGNNFSAYINLDFSNIVLNYGKDLDLLPDRETKSFASPDVSGSGMIRRANSSIRSA